jgi:ATP-dependent DNA ligase
MLRETVNVDHDGLALDQAGFDGKALDGRGDHGKARRCAFDLIELDGKSLWRMTIEHRKHALAERLNGQRAGIVFNTHFEGDRAIIYKHASQLGCEGIVSKRLSSPYRSGCSDHWLKIKNRAAPAVTREAEEDWGDKLWGRGRKHHR